MQAKRWCTPQATHLLSMTSCVSVPLLHVLLILPPPLDFHGFTCCTLSLSLSLSLSLFLSPSIPLSPPSRPVSLCLLCPRLNTFLSSPLHITPHSALSCLLSLVSSILSVFAGVWFVASPLSLFPLSLSLSLCPAPV